MPYRGLLQEEFIKKFSVL